MGEREEREERGKREERRSQGGEEVNWRNLDGYFR